MTQRYNQVKTRVAQQTDGQGLKMVEQRRMADQAYSAERPRGAHHLGTIQRRARANRVG
jgi:hypothetical protein